jgi:hypothetical protein
MKQYGNHFTGDKWYPNNFTGLLGYNKIPKNTIKQTPN